MADWELGIPPDDYEGNPFPHGIWEVDVQDMHPDAHPKAKERWYPRTRIEDYEWFDLGVCKRRGEYIIGLDKEKDNEYT